MDFDQSLMKQAAAIQAMSQSAQSGNSGAQSASSQLSSTPRLTQPSHANHMSPQANLSRAGGPRQGAQNPATQMSNGFHSRASGAASPPVRVTRGHKRARSPSSEQVSHPQVVASVQPGALSPQEVSHRIQIQKQVLQQPRWAQHAQQEVQQQQQQQQEHSTQHAQLQNSQQLHQQQHWQFLQQQQQQQQQFMPSFLPPGAIPIGLHHAGYQPLQATAVSQTPVGGSHAGQTLPHQAQVASPQQQQPLQKLSQKSPEQLPMRPMPSQPRAAKPVQVKEESPGSLADGVDGMSQDDIIAAAAAAAAASGYCEPKGLASLVGKSVKVKSSTNLSLPGLCAGFQFLQLLLLLLGFWLCVRV